MRELIVSSLWRDIAFLGSFTPQLALDSLTSPSPVKSAMAGIVMFHEDTAQNLTFGIKRIRRMILPPDDQGLLTVNFGWRRQAIIFHPYSFTILPKPDSDHRKLNYR
jgi:hypothetical protein